MLCGGAGVHDANAEDDQVVADDIYRDRIHSWTRHVRQTIVALPGTIGGLRREGWAKGPCPPPTELRRQQVSGEAVWCL